jgi:hypothetical protein
MVAPTGTAAPQVWFCEHIKMGDERDDDLGGWAQVSQGQHPDSTNPTGRIPHPRAGYHGSIPGWPALLIGPNATELARWSQLWRCPQAGAWARAEQQLAVAALVRLERRCAQARSSARALAELERLRLELGLDD